VTYLRLEFVGPRMVSVVGDVDLAGDDTESHLAVRLRALEARISASPAVAGTVLSLSAPDEPTLIRTGHGAEQIVGSPCGVLGHDGPPRHLVILLVRHQAVVTHTARQRRQWRPRTGPHHLLAEGARRDRRVLLET